ncbi:hypothetical protein [Aminobacter aminovorans]|uniref:hypothetical protein n=1 Tax=Aminobacter aminovorans TaxID=83263 RepID=UPI001047D89C|nr:hypothetical protein [Aminobacter aminovorans]
MALPASSSTGSNRQAVLQQVVRAATQSILINQPDEPWRFGLGCSRIYKRSAESETFVAAIHVSLTLRQHGTVTSNP